ncbi:hypothetical protein BDV97DRAFT_38871 [Delphinella strobiligena]|nr:hypothetical protein BDV97DRAFT_38871 [Delphinella strobiligena]
MSAAGSGGLSQAGIVGIGIGAGSLFLIAASAMLIKIYLRRREHSRAVAEIERGFGRSSTRRSEAAEVPNQKSPFGRNIISSCDSGEGYNALSSSEQIHHIPKFASPKKAHPALLVEDEGARKGLVDAGKWSRLNRISSKYRRVQALSAIIESPRSNLTRSSVPPTALIRVEHPSRAQSDVIEEGVQLAGNGQDLSPERERRSPSIAVPPRSALRPLTSTPSGFPLKTNVQPRAVLSKSIGSYIGTLPHETAANDASHHNRPGMHGRSLSFGAQVVGPAPSGPLPPLPSNAAILDQIDQQLAITLADTGKHNPTNSSPRRDWESMVDRDLSFPEQRLKTLAETERQLARAASENQLEKQIGSRPLSSSPFRLSMRFSTDSALSKLTTVSSIRTSLDDDFFNRLSIPIIETAEQLSVSRVPSSASLRSNREMKLVITPKRRRLAGSRVSGSGSPAERRKALKAVSGNGMSPQRPSSSMDKPSCIPLHFDKATISAKPSAMKGRGMQRSPGPRKGHRRQSFVRISTLAPTVFGPARSSSGSSFSMDEICEGGENPPCADRHMNGDITLRPKSQHFDPSRPRSSLMWSKSVPLYSPHGPSCDSSPMSISSFPSPTQEACHRIHGCSRNKPTSTPPVMTFTRPSPEWNHNHESPLSSSPPFALHVTPSAPAPNLYDPGYAAQSQEYDPTGPIITGLHDPPASGQEAEYDPSHEFALYSSPETSSQSSTKSLFNMSGEADDFPKPFSGLTITTSTPDGANRNTKPSSTGTQKQTDEVDSVVSAGKSSTTAPSPQTQDTPLLSQETKRENSSPISPTSIPFLAPAATLPSPLTTAPLLTPTIKPSTFRPLPPTVPRNSKRESKTTASPRNQAQSAQPPFSGITKQKPTSRTMSKEQKTARKNKSSPLGPRAPPPKDLRKSILQLRRENSSSWFSSDDLSRLSDYEDGKDECDGDGKNECAEDGNEFGEGENYGSLSAPSIWPRQRRERDRERERERMGQRRYLRLGREASPVSPFLGFGLGEADAGEDSWIEEGKKQKEEQKEMHVSGFDFGFEDVSSRLERSGGDDGDISDHRALMKEGKGEGDKGYGDQEGSDPRASMIVEKDNRAYIPGPGLFSTPNQSHTLQSPRELWTGNEGREENDGSHLGKGKAMPRSLYDESGFLRNSPLRGRAARLGQVGIY